jgi:tagatose 6-phosphate kinase
VTAILTVTPNFAVDVTYRVDRIRERETTVVQSVNRHAGGKGVNVARVLHALGHEAIVTGLAGGATGAAARAELAATGLVDRTVPIAESSRTTLMVVDDDGGATGFSEPGPRVAPGEWRAFVANFADSLEDAEAVVLAGSFPAGIPDTAYAELVELVRDRGRPVLLDAHGPALVHGAAARPTIVKVNADELAGAMPGGDVVAGAADLLNLGPGAVVITEGADGLLAVTGDGRWRARPPAAITGNATGAGDAASAALILGALHGSSWPDRLADAAALSAAAVGAWVAGAFDPNLYARLREQIAPAHPF